MSKWPYDEMYNVEVFRKESERLLEGIHYCKNINTARETLLRRATHIFSSHFNGKYPPAHELIRMRDCSLALLNVFSERSESRTGFSLVQAIWDIARGRVREDLKPGFYAEMINWTRGLEGRSDIKFLYQHSESQAISGREKAIVRSEELDKIWGAVNEKIESYSNGLTDQSQRLREKRKKRILRAFGANEDDWTNWEWHTSNVLTDTETLCKLANVEAHECAQIERALKGRLPFGVTPYYASLMDDKPNKGDLAIRAQVFPPEDYVNQMLSNNQNDRHVFDYMLETDTSPENLITRRYPGVAILKPVSTCPQICVYCQRNWEIEHVMEPNSFASNTDINTAIEWINNHPIVREVLITGGDPFILSDKVLESLLERISDIRHVDLIRIGTRTLVTLPMRITSELAGLLGKFREVGKRDIAVMTHIEHPYEITQDTALAVDKLRCQGIGLYNQQVYTFYVSRRFESTLLRILLRRIGIDPYYTFLPKCKNETNLYRVPLARILQEQKEEARLVPGTRRTDEAVFNVPGLGKNYLRAAQHRDLLTVIPDGRRVYEFHPWEMDLVNCQTYLYKDIAILDYLERLFELGEKPEDYDSIWFFF